MRSSLLQTFVLLVGASITSGFVPPSISVNNKTSREVLSTTTRVDAMSSSFVLPTQRNVEYGSNIAKYLVDMDDNDATFDFCGGMMFQLVLSKQLRTYLSKIAKATDEDYDGEHRDRQPIICNELQMKKIKNYSKDAVADNRRIFHGREIRRVPHATGGMGFVIQLSMAATEDPEGWSKDEIENYDGWGHDSGRTWRNADRYEAEGFPEFKTKFGPEAFGLHHRFYLHFDSRNRIWLSAEDGCEGTPSQGSKNQVQKFFGL